VDFLLALIAFLLDVTAEALRAGSVLPKISGRRGRPSNHSYSQKTRI